MVLGWLVDVTRAYELTHPPPHERHIQNRLHTRCRTHRASNRTSWWTRAPSPCTTSGSAATAWTRWNKKKLKKLPHTHTRNTGHQLRNRDAEPWMISYLHTKHRAPAKKFVGTLNQGEFHMWESVIGTLTFKSNGSRISTFQYISVWRFWRSFSYSYK